MIDNTTIEKIREDERRWKKIIKNKRRQEKIIKDDIL